MAKSTVDPEDMIDVREGRGKGNSNARPKKVDVTSDETDNETVKSADKLARAWHGSTLKMEKRK